MKILGRTLLIAAGLCTLAGIWTPEAWWQLLSTGALLLFTAAAILGNQRPDPARQTCPGCRRRYNTGAMHSCRSKNSPPPPPEQRPGNTTRIARN